MFPQLSENTANTVYWLGWSLVLLSAMLGLAGSMLGFWGDKERERYSDLRLSENEKETARANERAASLEKDAATARLELEQVKDRQRAKVITPKQKEDFIAFLKNSPREIVSVVSVGTDNRANSYARQIKDMFEAAGCIDPSDKQYRSVMGIFVTTRESICLMLCARPETPAASAAKTIQAALQHIGIDVDVTITDDKEVPVFGPNLTILVTAG